MSSFVNPVGPEEPRTYWVRRGVVLLAVLIVVALLIWALSLRGGETVATEPSPTRATSEATESAPTPNESPTTGAGDTPSATASSSESPTPGAADPTPGAGNPSASDSTQPGATASAPASPSAAASSTAPAQVAACKPEDLRVTLTGPPTAAAGKTVSLELSVINGGSQPCVFNVTANNLELKIYSGSDRIWTTAHCADWVPKIGATLAPEKSAAWSMAWPAKRSADKCTIRDDVLRPGTYVATAQVKGAKPVQHVMRVR